MPYKTFFLLTNGLRDKEFQQPEGGLYYTKQLSYDDPRMPRSSGTRGGGGGAASAYVSKGFRSLQVCDSDQDVGRLLPDDDRKPQDGTCESMTGAEFDKKVFSSLGVALRVSRQNGRIVPDSQARLDDRRMSALSRNCALEPAELAQHTLLCKELQGTANAGRDLSEDEDAYTITAGTAKLVIDISRLAVKSGDQVALVLTDTEHSVFGNLNRPIDASLQTEAQLREMLKPDNAKSLLENEHPAWFWQSWFRGNAYSAPYDDEGMLQQGGDRHGWFSETESMTNIAQTPSRANRFRDLAITEEMHVLSVKRDEESDKRTAQVTSKTDLEAGSKTRTTCVSGGAYGPPVMLHGHAHIAILEIYYQDQPEEQPAKEQPVFADTDPSCAICLEQMEQLKLLVPCGHTLCAVCWKEIEEKEKCPQCNQSVKTTAKLTASQLNDTEDTDASGNSSKKPRLSITVD